MIEKLPEKLEEIVDFIDRDYQTPDDGVPMITRGYPRVLDDMRTAINVLIRDYNERQTAEQFKSEMLQAAFPKPKQK